MVDLTNIETTYTRRFRTMSLKLDPKYRDLSYTASRILANPADVYPVLRSIFDKLDDGQEHMAALFLSAASKVIGYKVLFTGSQTAAIVDPKVIYRNGILFGASGIILAHTHPSENLLPSREDKEITRLIAKIGKLHDIQLMDHMIITHDGYTSLAESDPSLFE
jgi:DNA repair protein RadC